MGAYLHQDRILLVASMLHAADLSNPVLDYEHATAWGRRLSKEMNEQVQLERKLRLPVLRFMENPRCVGQRVDTLP